VPVSSHRHGSGKTNRVQAMQVDEILLIDDDVELCSMLIEYLGRFGFRVTAVHRGDTGLAAAQEKNYALVLLDVMLPGLDGLRCCVGFAPLRK